MRHLTSEYDVLVVGGGTAGVVAAIQAARAGQRVGVVEMGSMLGGTTTVAGVAYPGLFHAWGRQIAGGIGWELVERSVLMDKGSMPDFTVLKKNPWQHSVPVNPALLSCLAEEACLTAGVALHFHELVLATAPLAEGWSVETAGKGQRRVISCKELIDCTGDADIVDMLGYPRIASAIKQPGTLIFRIGNYSTDSMDEAVVQKQYQAALEQGELRVGDFSSPSGRFLDFLGDGGTNRQHVVGIDGSTASGKSTANIHGRASLMRLLRFVRTLPGAEHARILQMQPETGIRETYRIVGETTVTRDDFLGGRVFADAVGFSFFPIDIHLDVGAHIEYLPPEVVPTIPLSALIPKGSRRLLIAGRSISSDRDANSGLRVQASAMVMGQAAGAAAALGVQSGVASREVPIENVRALLARHGAILPDINPISTRTGFDPTG